MSALFSGLGWLCCEALVAVDAARLRRVFSRPVFLYGAAVGVGGGEGVIDSIAIKRV